VFLVFLAHIDLGLSGPWERRAIILGAARGMTAFIRVTFIDPAGVVGANLQGTLPVTPLTASVKHS